MSKQKRKHKANYEEQQNNSLTPSLLAFSSVRGVLILKQARHSHFAIAIAKNRVFKFPPCTLKYYLSLTKLY